MDEGLRQLLIEDICFLKENEMPNIRTDLSNELSNDENTVLDPEERPEESFKVHKEKIDGKLEEFLI